MYANDTAGNAGASETVHFTVNTEQPKPQNEPFPWIVVAAVVAVIAVLAVLIYFVRFRKKP